MSPPSPPQRSYIPSPTLAQSGRRATAHASQSQSQSLRPAASYSSLGDALGSMRAASAYMSEFSAGPSSTSTNVQPSSHAQNDHRYMYHPSGMPSAYEYPSYQQPTYDTSPQYTYPASSLPPMRGAVSPPPPPSSSAHSHYNPPPQTAASHHNPSAVSPVSTYSHYPQTPQYAIQNPTHTPHQHQWSEESWAPSTQPFSPDPAQPIFATGRGEVAASPQADPRAYMTQQYTAPLSGGGRPDNRGTHAHEPAQPKGKEREREREQSVMSTDRVTRTDFDSGALDFTKLLETYRQVITDCSTVMNSNVQRAEDVDRMLRSANFGLHMFETSSASLSDDRRASGDSSVAEVQIISPPEQPPKRQGEASGGDGQTCLGCGATSTPEWRRGPLGPRTLCNACGLVYAKLIKKRGREMGANSLSTQAHSGSTQAHRASHPNPSSNPGMEEDTGFASPGDGGSDDEHSFGSQDPQ